MLVFSGTTLFSARLFYWHDFSFSVRLFFGTTFCHSTIGTTFCFRHVFFFFSPSRPFFRHDFLFWRDCFFSARLFLLNTNRAPLTYRSFIWSEIQATGCLKCRFLLFLLLISFSTCTGVLPEKMQGVTGRTYILALTSMSFRDFPFL